MSALQWASALLLPLACGAASLGAMGIRRRDDAIAYWGWAYALGSLVIGALVFLWGWTGWTFDARFLAPVAAALATALWLAGRRRVHTETPIRGAPQGLARTVFLIVLVFALAFTAHRVALGTLNLLVDGDEAHIWAIKAKTIFHSGGFRGDFRTNATDLFLVPHVDYPLLNPLLHVWVFAHAGSILHWENRIPIQLFGLATVLVLAGALRRSTPPLVAAGLLLAFCTLEWTIRSSATGLADLMVALGLLVTLDGWLRWSNSGEKRWWALGCCGAALMLWSKNDAQLYLVAIAAAAVLARIAGRPARSLPHRSLAWLALPALVLAIDWGFNAWFGFENDMVVGDPRAGSRLGAVLDTAGERLGPIAAYMWSEVLAQPAHDAYLFLAFLVLLAVVPRIVLRGGLRVPTLALLFTLAGYVLVYVATPHDLTWHLQTSAGRVMFQPVPSLFLWMAAAVRALGGETSEGGSP